MEPKHLLAVQIYSELVKAAMLETTITWAELTNKLSIPAHGAIQLTIVNNTLSDLCAFDIKNGRTPLSAVLVRPEKVPGKGYYTMLINNGIEVPEEEKRKVDLWKKQLEKVYQEWSIQS